MTARNDLSLYLDFAVPIRIREIQHGHAAHPADWTPNRLMSDITRGINDFASNGDAIQYGNASRKARARALDGLVTSVAAAVITCGPLDILDTHLCAQAHDGCPLRAPEPTEADLDARLREVLDELAAVVEAEAGHGGGYG